MIMAFFGWVFLICSFYRFWRPQRVKEQRGGRSRRHKILPLVVHGFWGRDFLHLCGWLELHWFLKANSVYNSIIETKEVQGLIMKVGSVNVCLFSCQFYHTYELILMKLASIVRFNKEKNICISILIWLLKLMENISKYNFSDEGVSS